MNFIELNTLDVIKADCILSKENGNKIPCTLEQKGISSEYALKAFAYSDEIETITIVQNNTNDYLFFECKTNYNNKNQKKEIKGLTNGVIIGIILAIGGFIIIVALIIHYLSCCRKNKDNPIQKTNSGMPINEYSKNNILDN